MGTMVIKIWLLKNERSLFNKQSNLTAREQGFFARNGIIVFVGHFYIMITFQMGSEMPSTNVN